MIFSAASLLRGVAQSPLMLNLSRGVQGIGGALGSIFTSEVRAHVSSGLHTAHLGGARTIATAISSGQTHQAIAHIPLQARGIVGKVARISFVAGLNEILLVAAVVALAGAIAALLLIRSSDFVVQTVGQRDGRPAEAPEPARA